jgi:hypothetical protein
MDNETLIATTKSAEAVAAATDAARAIEDARVAQMVSAFTTALDKTFNLNDINGPKRFLDMSRVPLICQAIIGIHESLEDIKKNMVSKDQFWPVKTFVYGLVGVLLTGIAGAILPQILKLHG